MGVTLVPLAGLTGASGEVHVTDVDGQAWTLRDGRHLGERRIQAAKEDMSCDAGPSGDGAARDAIMNIKGKRSCANNV